MTVDQFQHFSDMLAATSAVLAFGLGYIAGYLP